MIQAVMLLKPDSLSNFSVENVIVGRIQFGRLEFTLQKLPIRKYAHYHDTIKWTNISNAEHSTQFKSTLIQSKVNFGYMIYKCGLPIIMTLQKYI